MLILSFGLLLFLLLHLLRELGLRDTLIGLFSSRAVYRGAYSIAALIGLALIAWGKSRSPFIMLWQPAYELRSVSYVLMIPALILLVAGNLPYSHLGKRLRNPMLLAVTIWGLSHLWSNGDVASMLLFGSIGLWSIVKFVSLSKNKPTVNERASVVWDGISIVIGLLLYYFLVLYHGLLFGVGLSLA